MIVRWLEFLKEYEVEQIWRDVRKTAIYEGANGIHERSLVTRGLRPGGGADQIARFVAELVGENALADPPSSSRVVTGKVSSVRSNVRERRSIV